MKLYILRHGHSPSTLEARVKTDEARPISERGRQDIRESARRLAAKGATPAIILSSPLKRARQTAEEAAGVLHPKNGVRIFAPLSNHIPGSDLYREVLSHDPAAAELLIVGHQPQLGDLVSSVTGKTVELKPGGVVALETKDSDSAALLWAQNP